MKPIHLRILILLSTLFLQTEHSLASVQGELPQIDSHKFEAKAISKSTSGKVYLFKSTDVMPKTGNLILVYENDKPVMAFRVLKNENDLHHFVAKRVRRYDETGELAINRIYTSVEKLGDIIPAPPTEPTTAEPTEKNTQVDSTKKDPSDNDIHAHTTSNTTD